MELIVSEKNTAARRIANILSDGAASADRQTGVTVYSWDDHRVIGLSGHVVGVDFPDSYSNWTDIDPVELLDAEIIKTPTAPDHVASLKRLARSADRVVIATDYDREGELIGKEAVEIVRDVNAEVPIDRVRFSSLTENAVRDAFDDRDDLDVDLAAAGEARQIIDLIWGAALTRFLSLAANQYGDDFISVGRVQSPTLKLLVDREREIEAFDPESYWEIVAALSRSEGDQSFEAQYYYLDVNDTEAERIWSESDAEAIYHALRDAESASVTEVQRQTRTDRPPVPFDTTQFIRAAGAIGFSAKQAMSIAETLYTAGYITYPRTDNTVYPRDFNPRGLLSTFAETREFGDDARDLLAQDSISPTRGDRQTTDHPPIHPTGDLPARQTLSGPEWQVYELVVRRFMATVAPSAIWKHLGVRVSASGLALKANGKRLDEPGYHAVYPYFSTEENYVPPVEIGETLIVENAELAEKQTDPPRRYGQSRLIETMEDMGIGTKCLTSDTHILRASRTAGIEPKPAAAVFSEGRILTADGDADIAVNPHGTRTLSFHERSGCITQRAGPLVSKRPLESDERVLTILTETGSFSVTNDHQLYLGDGRSVVPASAVEPGDQLLATRPDSPMPPTEERPLHASWPAFAGWCDRSTPLYGVPSAHDSADSRGLRNDQQAPLTRHFAPASDRRRSISPGRSEPPIWVLDEVGIKPAQLRGPPPETSFENPFPLQWSAELARIMANLLGSASSLTHTGDTRFVNYSHHNQRLAHRFAADAASIFDLSSHPTPRLVQTPSQTTYRVTLPRGVSTILQFLCHKVTATRSEIPAVVAPWFLAAAFDDGGTISTTEEAVTLQSNTQLIETAAELLVSLDIDADLAQAANQLRIDGRQNLALFFDQVPIATDTQFYRGLEVLAADPMTREKARILEHTDRMPMTPDQLARTLGYDRARVDTLVRELWTTGYLKHRNAANSSGHLVDESTRYEATGFDGSIYGILLGYPGAVTVLSVRERGYDGAVYDLSIDDAAPNFAVDGGAIVHNSTRHNVVDKLYDRGYVEGDPPVPTELARGVIDAAEEYADLVVSEAMTVELEEDMTAIANGDKSLEEVTDQSRAMLKRVFAELGPSADEIGARIREAIKQDKALGPCPESSHQLLIRTNRNGAYFIGCDGYPDCEYTIPLPNTGKPVILEEVCREHELSHVKMLAGDRTFVHGCPQCQADEADEAADRLIGDCPDCGSHYNGELAVKTLRSGSRLVGCTRYPDCDYSLPLPRRGELEVTDVYCDDHGLPELVVHGTGEPWELGCPICNYQAYRANQAGDDGALQTITGIGEKTADKLTNAGIADVADLKDADPDEVAGRIDGVSASQIREWQAKP